MLHSLSKWVSLLFIIILLNSHLAQAITPITLSYKAKKNIITIGQMHMQLTRPQSEHYQLEMMIRAFGKQKNFISEGTLSAKDILTPLTYHDDKYQLDNKTLNATTLDPLASLWQIMPLLANNNQQCDNITIYYFSGKSYYLLAFSDRQEISLHKKHRHFNASHVFSCQMVRSKKNETKQQISKMIFITIPNQSQPVIYQFSDKNNIIFTLNHIKN